MKLQLSKSDRDKQFALARQRQIQDKLRTEEDSLRKDAVKKEREFRKRIKAEQSQQAEEKERVEKEAEEFQKRNSSVGQWNKQMVNVHMWLAGNFQAQLLIVLRRGQVCV